MIHLTREVRFNLVPGGGQRPLTNSWGGWPSATVISPSLVMRCELSGDLEPDSGYLCNIKLIDDAIRDRVIRYCCDQNPTMTAEQIVRFGMHQLANVFPANCQMERLQLCVTPTLEYTIHRKDDPMIQLTQQFEFSASHRLHNPRLTDEENQRVFGKCNNPHGHGHNYVLMVTVEGNPDEEESLIPLEEFEVSVKREVIDLLDHKHLNVEVAAFRDRNPSVENIAMVIWTMLEASLPKLGEGKARLARVRVYETPKTWADYFGPSIS